MAQDLNPKKTAARNSRRRRRLPENPICIGCGVNDPVLLEEHHVAGEAHDTDLTVVHCKNCHATATEGQRQGEVPLQPAPSLPETLAAILRAIGAFAHTLGDFIVRIARQLEDFVRALDVVTPDWRSKISEELST